jgi:ketosteroid isomerase-like protein
MLTKTMVTAAAVAAVATAVQDWVTAAVNQDASKYCKGITQDLLEQVTGA